MLAISSRADPKFRADVLAGLSLPQPAIPARWFYDELGSELFEAITRLPSYYLTRTETALLAQIAPELSAHVPSGGTVIELGAGSAAKTPAILRACKPAAYVPIDVSAEFLKQSAERIATEFPDLAVIPLVVDFTQPFALRDRAFNQPRLAFFPGSTIGNFEPGPAADILRRLAGLLGEGALLLIGMDRIKDTPRLIAAYDDPEGVTARFNVNLLERINRELDGSVPVRSFRHEARWNAHFARIEMHLVARDDVDFAVCGQRFAMAKGTSIHTENSHKYDRDSAARLLRDGRWTPFRFWTDEQADFLIVLARATPIEARP